MAEDFVIEMLHITKEFPGIKANDDITLQLRKGEVHALLGENGAGGLGLIMNEKIGWREYDSLGMILIVLFVAVMVIEGISHGLRKRLT